MREGGGQRRGRRRAQALLCSAESETELKERLRCEAHVSVGR